MSIAATTGGLLATFGGTLQLAAPLSAHGQQTSTLNRSIVAENYGKLPLSFEANQGQTDPKAKFLSRGSGYALFLTDSSAVLALTKQDASNALPDRAVRDGLKPASVPHAKKTDVVRMELAGASHDIHVAGTDRLPGSANYFIGNDSAKWHIGVPTYSKVQYTGVYPGVDLVYYGSQRQLEYDFVVAPGANPKPIQLQFVGAKSIKLTANGDLTVSARNGEIAFHKPVIYQNKEGHRQLVEGQFSISAKNTVGFTLGRYDRAESLVIDPVLVYSTYFGSLALATAIAVDSSSGSAYVTGQIGYGSVDVTAGAFQAKNNGEACPQQYCTNEEANAFVVKLNPLGTALLYSTYLGGGYGDYGTGIAVDSAGNAYVTGMADSRNFPVTTGAYQTVNNAASYDVFNSTEVVTVANAFVTKLNPTGTALIYSTYLGGSGIRFPNAQAPAPGYTEAPYAYTGDYASGIAVDGSGNAYVTGLANSTDFPVTAGAFQTMNNSQGWVSPSVGIAGNAFVSKLNPSGTALVYSTYLGGRGTVIEDSGYEAGDSGTSIAVDGSGNAYVTGLANSTDFPVTAGAFQTANAKNGGKDFVTKINSTGTALLYSTYLGGSFGGVSGSGIALDVSGNAYVTGATYSNDFPVTTGAFQTVTHAPSPSPGGSYISNAFVTKLNATGAALVYSTYLGGTGTTINHIEGDFGTGIAVDGSGDAYVIGYTASTNFPVTAGAFQTVNNAAAIHSTNAFLTKLNSAGSALLYSTYLGGSGQGSAGDAGTGIAVDILGNAYVTGQSSSTNFPVTVGAFQTTNESSIIGQSPITAFVAKLNLGTSTISPTVTVTPSSSSITTAQSLTVTVAVSGEADDPTPTGAVTLISGSYTSAAVILSSGSVTISIPAGSLATGADTLTATYTPDSSSSSTYNTAAGTSSAVTVAVPIGTATATVTVTPSATTITNQESESVTIAVAGGSGVATPTGTVTLSSGSYSAQQTLASGAASFTIAAGILGSGANTLTAAYSGDATYASDTGTSAVTVSQVGIAAPAPSSVSPGASATSTVTLSAGSTFSGTMNLTCTLTSSPTGAQSLPTCSLNPASVTLGFGGTGTTVVTISTTAASTTALTLPLGKNLWELSGGGVVLAGLLMLGLPLRRRRWMSMLDLLWVVVAAGAIGCGNGGTSNSAPPSTPSTRATTAGSYTFTVTATSGTVTASATIPVSVQ
jgi:hypothetical protein